MPLRTFLINLTYPLKKKEFIKYLVEPKILNGSVIQLLSEHEGPIMQLTLCHLFKISIYLHIEVHGSV